MQQRTWTITEIRHGEDNEVRTGLSREEALVAIRRAMSASTEPLLTTSESSVHELPLAA